MHPDVAFHQMGTAILKVIKCIFVIRIELQGQLVNLESIVVAALGQQAVAHVEHCFRLQFGVGVNSTTFWKASTAAS